MDERSNLSQYKPLLPSVLGLACARVGLVAMTPAGHVYADAGVLSDAALVIGMAVVAAVMLVVFKARYRFSKRFVNALVHVSVAVQVVGAVVLFASAAAPIDLSGASFVASIAVMLASLACVAYWLRRVRGSSMSTAVVTVFGAVAVSEIPVFLLTFFGEGIHYLVAAPIVFAQLFCIRAARKQAKAYSIETPTRSDDYFSFMRKGIANARFLAASAIGLCFLSFVGGFLCGFPDGQHAAVHGFVQRIMTFLLVEALCVGLVFATLRQRSRVMTVGIWVILELLAAFSLVAYAATHGNAEYGAVFATVLFSVMSGFVWYLIIAFMSYGGRDPFYYAMGLWLVWTASHAIGRFVPFLAGPVGPLAGDSHLMGTVISLLLLVSTQTVLVKLIDVARFAYEEESARLTECVQSRSDAPSSCAECVGGVSDEGGASPSCTGVVSEERDAVEHRVPPVSPKSGTLEKLLGIDNDSAVSDVRDAAMRHGAEAMGRQFLLSEREVEVLALYMSGLTQKRVAEQLHISQTTAHTHIGRIYAKTGLHSRQEILDYVRNHVD